MNRYAQIDTETGRVVGVSHLAGPIDAPHLIALTEGQDVLGMVWDGTQFVPGPPEPPDPSVALRVAEKTAAAIRQQIDMEHLLETDADRLTEQQLHDIAPLFDLYEVGVAYRVNKVLRFDGGLYRVLQAHTSQADWPPNTTASLYVAHYQPHEIPDWTMPAGAHDAPNIGDKRRHDGLCWQSLIDANTTEPGSDPRWWEQITCP